MAWHLQNKTALVTGGTKGIGKAIVEGFLRLGASVVAVARNVDNPIEWAENVDSSRLKLIAADLADSKSVTTLLNELKDLDILVNNVGTNIRKKYTEFTEEEYAYLLNTNLHSFFRLTKACHPKLKESKGSVISIASVAGLNHLRTGVIYGMTKAAMIQFTKNLAVEWAPDGIRVNCVSPWYIETPLAANVLKNKEYLADILARTPMNRIGKPEEVAAAVAFLAMDNASYITGQNLAIDGGFSVNSF